jgi:hypothetical protein
MEACVYFTCPGTPGTLQMQSYRLGDLIVALGPDLGSWIITVHILTDNVAT